MDFGDGAALQQSDGYTEDGMIVSGNNANEVQNWQNATTSLNGTGEREILLGPDITFSLVSGLAFDLLSFDIENPFGSGTNWSAAGGFLVTGSNGATATFSASTFGTQILTGFTNITSFTIGCGQYWCQVTVDNIVFDQPSAVPVPAGLPLLLAGLGGLAMVRRRSLAAQ